MSHDFIENALTRLRDNSELVALRADKVRLTAEVSCLEAVIRSHERVDCLQVTSLKKQLVEVDAENARLKAEVERLTKHNQTLIKELENTDCMFAMASAFARDWNAAKGVQS
jgi:cell division protein FtsB